VVNVIIQKFNQEDPDFWLLMGRNFASAAIRRELGVPMSSDESYLWLLAMESGKVIGFCAIATNKKGDTIRHLYVVAEKRGQGIGGKLIKKAASTKSPKVATVSSKCLSLWSRCGFSPTGAERGQYVEVCNG
jgi:GNAT superfamily N-acetyltransferase